MSYAIVDEFESLMDIIGGETDYYLPNGKVETVKKIKTNSTYGKLLKAQAFLETGKLNYIKDSHMINCGVCHKPTDTFIKGNVEIHNNTSTAVGKLTICAGCLENLAKAFDKKYKKQEVVETTADTWEAWSTPTDES